MNIFDPLVTYGSFENNNSLALIQMVRQGIKYNNFLNFAEKSPFTLNEWSSYLHLSERTMQRYEKEKSTFDALQSEKILEIAMLYKKGLQVFGNTENFHLWLSTSNIALGKIKPKSLLDSSFGINLLKDELFRIEHGILA